MKTGELREKMMEAAEENIAEIRNKVEHIMDYIKGERGTESDYEILNTVDADIEDLWKALL